MMFFGRSSSGEEFRQEMLEELRVENLAIADSVNVNFASGFNVITGETGAGKSLIVDAIALLAGERATSEMVRSSCDHLSVEGAFASSGSAGLLGFLDSAGIEGNSDEVILRRQVYSDGRSRAFINGSMITISSLKEAGGFLLDIHGQHEHQSLISRENHILYLDEFAGLNEKRSRILPLRKKLSDFREREHEHLMRLNELKEKKDYIEFQLEEIESARIVPEEEESLESERRILLNAGRLSSSLNLSYDFLYDGEGSVSVKLAKVLKEMDSIKEVLPEGKEYEDALREAEIHVKAVAQEISKLKEEIESNPKRLEEIEERLYTLSRLKLKHKCSTRELLEIAEGLKRELSMVSGEDLEGDTLKEEITSILDELSKLSDNLRKARLKAISRLEERMKDELSILDMKSTRFSIQIENIEDESSGIRVGGKELKLWDTGVDRIEFLVSTNPGEGLKPLSRIASGGEISRIMLALRSILHRQNEVETVIFDEIDSGIGGKAARTVGERLKRLGEKVQVICITHLPIIASQADVHFVVEKKSLGRKAGVSVERVSGERRVAELARMLAGDRATGTTLRQAKELLASERSQS